MAGEQKQIDGMISFIQTDAKDKADEIEQEAQETYTIEKLRMIEAEKKKIKTEFERKEKQCAIEKRIKQSNLQKEQRLRVLKERDDCLKDMVEVARKKLAAVTTSGDYPKILANLISQSAQELPVGVPLKVLGLEKDKSKLSSALADASSKYKAATGNEVKLSVSSKTLPEEAIGGVILETEDGKMKCINTLKAREETVMLSLLPRFRKMLFD
eukprot:NODE_1669_length_799_cov_247.845333_g1297_i0.p1 GENE.NODE_1669_length_799_cov_247.845333_g1297_i0~~NODE_1669_length_799_cov_247.845333_g1297_i0.p1  ORF type:complete len:213 (+),score=68.54 NODE_1669_length_799_cov_247.845333_g1297_i0:95-733(+)